MKKDETIQNYTEKYSQITTDNSTIDPQLFDEFGVKRGLRDKSGKGVLAGLTKISDIRSNEEIDGKLVPCEGQLFYRGYNIYDLVKGFDTHRRYGFEEVTYLLLYGNLPTQDQLQEFSNILIDSSNLPRNFTRDVIMKAPTKDIMNSLTKSVLTLSSYDKEVDDLSLDNVLRQCLKLISTFPTIICLWVPCISTF